MPLAYTCQARARLCSACSCEPSIPQCAPQQDCLCTQMLTPLSTKHTTTHTRHAHTPPHAHTHHHTPSRTHTPSHTPPHAHTHMNSRAHMPSHTHALLHTHTHACTHCRVCILQVVLRGLALLFLGRKTAPPGLQDTKEPHHMPTVPGTSTQFRRLFSSGRVLTVPFSS